MKTNNFSLLGTTLSRNEMRNVLGSGHGYYECNNGSYGSSTTTTLSETERIAEVNCGSEGVKKTICSGEGC